MPGTNVALRVKISEDVLFQELQGEAVLLNLKTGVYFGLDTTGTRMWQLMGQHPLLTEVVQTMVQEYDVTKEQCAEDLLELVRKMEDHGLLLVE